MVPDFTKIKAMAPKTAAYTNVVMNEMSSGNLDYQSAMGVLMLHFEKECASLNLRPNLPQKIPVVKRDINFFLARNDICRKIIIFLMNSNTSFSSKEVGINLDICQTIASPWLTMMAKNNVVKRFRDKKPENKSKIWVYYI
tara:strand:- start:1 stop:423 length:423 start_codon:yes stop_codon:yes gene_type:complete